MIAPRLEIRADAAALARAAARFVTECAARATAERNRFTVAFSGGSTPGAMLAGLAAEDLPWHQMQVFQVDERVAPRGDADRNLTQLAEALLGNTPLASDALHPMPVEAGDLESAASEYAATLRRLAGAPAVLDLVHLGLGDDGHTASLVPGDAVLEVDDDDVAVTAPYHGHRRMTLTLPLISRARTRMWLVTGAGKSAILERLMAGDTGIPAGRVSRENAVVFADTAAAGDPPP